MSHHPSIEPNGKRAWKKVDDGTVTETVYVCSNGNCVAEYAKGADPSQETAEYVYALGVDSLVRVRNSHGEFTVTRNQQWSVTALVKTAGQVVERYAYDLFGKRTVLNPDGTVGVDLDVSLYDMPFGYTSRRHEEESGLMYFRARYYDPATGEFISRDPLEYVDGMSHYRGYFAGVGSDPSGTYLRDRRQIPPCEVTCQDESKNLCGPDLTMAFNAYLRSIILTLNSVPWYSRGPGAVPTLALIGDNIDFYYITDVTGCAIGQCSGTVEFCGMCVRNTVLNNILFGYVAAAIGASQTNATNGAAWADNGWDEGKEQEGAYDIGYDLWNDWINGNAGLGRKGLCTVVKNAYVYFGLRGTYSPTDAISSAFASCTSCGKSRTLTQVWNSSVNVGCGFTSKNAPGRGRQCCRGNVVAPKPMPSSTPGGFPALE